jgi:hypothetical protein
MRRTVLFVGLLLIAAVVGGAGVAYAEGEPPAAHQAIPAYTGPETCAMCHPTAAQEVVDSLHYQHQGEVPFREGWEEGVLGGMYVTF